MPPDLIIYGLIAAGLIFWLRSVLGARDEGEPKRQNPYLSMTEENGNVIPFGESRSQNNGENLIAALAQNPKGNMSIESRSVELALMEIAKADRGFDVYVFLQAAQDAFVYIVESFAEGDRETLRDLLGPQVYDAFEGAISTREQAGESMKTEIRGIKKAEITGARVEGSIGLITVRFIAEETTVTRDKNGEILFGHPDKTTQMRDVWTFARDLRGRDPRWLVIETREDGLEDNTTIPNTH